MQPTKPHIVFIHLLNNFSGSPNVLSVVIKGFLAKGYKVSLITSRGEGFLSGIDGVNYRYTCYRWLNNKWTTAMLLILSQIDVFFKVLFSKRKGTIYYINTIVPFGAVWACFITGKKYIYHVHENMQQNKPVYRLFRFAYKWFNRKSIFVSHYLWTTALNCNNGKVVYNGLDHAFMNEANKYLSDNPEKTGVNILMVSTLRKYKGVYEFVRLAKELKQYTFELVLSADADEVNRFATEVEVPGNLTIYPKQNDLHPFYQRAKLLLQLSHPLSCVETFGLSILEAMVYGIPSIVPNVGGPVELVEEGINGYQIDADHLAEISQKIQRLMEDHDMYHSFSNNALAKSREFSEEKMMSGIEKYILE